MNLYAKYSEVFHHYLHTIVLFLVFNFSRFKYSLEFLKVKHTMIVKQLIVVNRDLSEKFSKVG